MPYADPERKRANAKRYREEMTAAGYGKAMYARRAQRYRNEEIFREAVEAAVFKILCQEYDAALKILRKALGDAKPIGKPIEYMPKEKKK